MAVVVDEVVSNAPRVSRATDPAVRRPMVVLFILLSFDGYQVCVVDAIKHY